jgi:toxin-antitoxin system PIN domain toxin
MILVDANVLIYAYHPQAAQHAAAKQWVEGVFSGAMPVRLAWTTVVAFVRIMTSAQVFRRPLTLEEALAAIDSWLAVPVVDLLVPGDRHWAILREMLVGGQAIGPLASDADLAALAIEHGAVLATTDRDFARFPGLETINPLDTTR